MSKSNARKLAGKFKKGNMDGALGRNLSIDGNKLLL